MSAQAGETIGRLKPEHERNREKARDYLEELDTARQYLQAIVDDQPFPMALQGFTAHWHSVNWPTRKELQRFITNADDVRMELAKAIKELGLQ